MLSNDCSRSHGHPPGARSCAMIATDCSKRVAARAGSETTAVPGAVGLDSGLSAVRPTSIQFSLNPSYRKRASRWPRQQTVYSISRMIRILVTVFAALLGLAFGSFLNVCLSRWPEGESVVKPRSHCRTCNRTLTWWENIPVLSWLFLRGRCRTCGTKIHWRYPLVEAAVAILWAICAWRFFPVLPD